MGCNKRSHMHQSHPIDEFIAARRVDDPGFNKGKFADLVESDRSTIHRLMSGHDSVSNDLMEKIEQRTGISAVALFAAWQTAKKARHAAEAATTPARA